MQLQLTGQLTGIEARNGGWFAISFQEQGSTYPKKLSTKKAELVQQCQQMMGQWVDALYNESESTNINPNNGQPYMNRYLEAIAMAGSLPQQQPQPQPQPQFQGQPAGFAGQPAAVPFTPQPQVQFPPQFPPNQQPVMQPQVQQQVAQQHSGVQMTDVREARIMRQAAAKVAVQLIDHLDPGDRTLASVVRISEQLVGYFRDGVQWSVPAVQPNHTPQQPSEQAQQQHQAGFNGPPVDPSDYQQEPQQAAPDNYDDIPF